MKTSTQTGAHTQNIEYLWRITKQNCSIRVNGASLLLERRLQEEWWRSMHPSKNSMFDDFFLNDMKATFCE